MQAIHKRVNGILLLMVLMMIGLLLIWLMLLLLSGREWEQRIVRDNIHRLSSVLLLLFYQHLFSSILSYQSVRPDCTLDNRVGYQQQLQRELALTAHVPYQSQATYTTVHKQDSYIHGSTCIHRNQCKEQPS